VYWHHDSISPSAVARACYVPLEMLLTVNLCSISDMNDHSRENQLTLLHPANTTVIMIYLSPSLYSAVFIRTLL